MNPRNWIATVTKDGTTLAFNEPISELFLSERDIDSLRLAICFEHLAESDPDKDCAPAAVVDESAPVVEVG